MSRTAHARPRRAVKGHGQLTAVGWNAECPVGTRVRYFPILGDPECCETVTRSEAWELPGNSHLVLIEGRAGGVSLKHLQVIR